MTDRIYSTDAYARSMDAVVLEVDAGDGRLLLDRTVFYPGGGGQPADTGELAIGDDRLAVTRVAQDSNGIWHWVDGGLPSPRHVTDGLRRLAAQVPPDANPYGHACLVRCGLESIPEPGDRGNMKPGEGRLDFELPQWDPEEGTARS